MMCEDDGANLKPKYMYYVNVTGADETTSANMVFFNEAMTSLLNIECEDMVIKHGHTDPKVLPNPMLSIRGIPKIMHVTIKKNGTINVYKVENATIEPSTSADQIEIVPQTGAFNVKGPKKQEKHAPGLSEKQRCNKKIKR